MLQIWVVSDIAPVLLGSIMFIMEKLDRSTKATDGHNEVNRLQFQEHRDF